jgi:mono/diheme cytochrome c family protein
MRQLVRIVVIVSVLLAIGLPLPGRQSEAAPEDSREGGDHPPSGPRIVPDGLLREDVGGLPAIGPRAAQEEHGAAQKAHGSPEASLARQGQSIFHTRCMGCHSIGAHLGSTADLLNVPRTRDRAWVVRWLASPEQMLKEGDPIATALVAKNRNIVMPTLRLTPDDVEAILTFLEVQALERGTE